jgi:hypothetical protein
VNKEASNGAPASGPAAGIAYLDGNGWLCHIRPGTLERCPAVGADFFSAERADGTLVVISRRQMVKNAGTERQEERRQ